MLSLTSEKLLQIQSILDRQDFSPEERLAEISFLISGCQSGTATPILQLPVSLDVMFRLGNTLLSTIRLNKLIHLLLSVLVSESAAMFERSMLFLRVEKTGILQGMVGIARDDADGIVMSGGRFGSLSGRWELPEEVISRQRTSEFCSKVRVTRIEPHASCPITLALDRGEPILASNEDCKCCPGCNLLDRFSITSFAVVPLLSEDICPGVMLLDNPSSGVTSGTNLELLSLLSFQAGMAMKNSLMYNRLETALERLKDAQERLVHGERLAAIGEMAANVVHELKNPLITIGGFASRLLKVLPAEGTEQRYAKTIVSEVARLEHLLADILAFSRKPTICFVPCSPGQIIADCLAGFGDVLSERGITVSISMPEQNVSVQGDPYQLKQVFLNLIINASDVMKEGGQLDISGQLKDSVIEICFRDTGGGVPSEVMPRIFSPFFNTKKHGTGLGLPIANRIILNHQGKMDVTNEAKGACFRIVMPVIANL